MNETMNLCAMPHIPLDLQHAGLILDVEIHGLANHKHAHQVYIFVYHLPI